MLRVFLFAIATSAVACAGTYASPPDLFALHYTPNTTTELPPASEFETQARPELLVEILQGSEDREADELRMFTDGYVLLGTSEFASVRGGSPRAKAKDVGATHVLTYMAFDRTIHGTRTVYTPGRTQTSTTWHQNDPLDWSAPASSTTTTRTPGRTDVVPTAEDQYLFAATYWVRTKRPPFGARLRPLDDEARQRAETNRGCEVYAVVKDTNAFNADVLRGDVLIEVDGQRVVDMASCKAQLSRVRGTDAVPMTFIRNGERREVEISVDALRPSQSISHPG